MNKDLYNRTIELAKSTKLSPKDICASLKVTERWFYKFISGEIKNPGVHNVQSLHDLLIKHSPEHKNDDKRSGDDRRASRRKKIN